MTNIKLSPLASSRSTSISTHDVNSSSDHAAQMDKAAFLAENRLESCKILLYPSPNTGVKIKVTFSVKMGWFLMCCVSRDSSDVLTKGNGEKSLYVVPSPLTTQKDTVSP